MIINDNFVSAFLDVLDNNPELAERFTDLILKNIAVDVESNIFSEDGFLYNDISVSLFTCSTKVSDRTSY